MRCPDTSKWADFRRSIEALPDSSLLFALRD